MRVSRESPAVWAPPHEGYMVVGTGRTAVSPTGESLRVRLWAPPHEKKLILNYYMKCGVWRRSVAAWLVGFEMPEGGGGGRLEKPHEKKAS